jgi:hypothetical protein
MLHPTPLSCLSTPVTSNGELVGVLTLYSSVLEPFTPAHAVMSEVIAGELASLASRVITMRHDVAKRSPLFKASPLRLVGQRAEAAGGRAH